LAGPLGHLVRVKAYQTAWLNAGSGTRSSAWLSLRGGRARPRKV